MKKNNNNNNQYDINKKNSNNNQYNINKNNSNNNQNNMNNKISGNSKNLNSKSRRKRKNSNYTKTIFAILIFAIILVLLIISISKIFDKKNNKVSENNSQNTTSTISNSQLNSIFWGDKINFKQEINPVKTGTRLDKWPSESGFETKLEDIKKYAGKPISDKVLEGITVILDPGHGGEDLGAVYPRAPKKPQIIESHVNLDIAFIVKDYLEQMGAKVLLTREDDTYFKLYYRSAFVAKATLNEFYGKLSDNSQNKKIVEEYLSKIDYALKVNDDKDPESWFYGLGVRKEIKDILDLQRTNSNFLFLSIHCNSSEIPNTMHGSKVYYASNIAVYDDEIKIEKDRIFPEYQFYDDDNRQKLASILYKNIISYDPKMIPNETKNPVTDRNYSVIREQNIVSALVELGYVNNNYDMNILNSDEGKKGLAKTISSSIYEYFCK